MRFPIPALLLPFLAVPAAATAQPTLVLDAGGHTGTIWDAVFVPGRRELVTVSYDKTIRVWDLATGQTARTLRPPVEPGPGGRLISAAVSPDGKMLAVAAVGVAGVRNPIYLIALDPGRIVHTLEGHGTPVNTVAFSPDGKRLASSANDKTARLWDVATGKVLHVLRGHTAHTVNWVTFSPDGARVATAGSDGTARLWAADTGELVETVRHRVPVFAVAFRPDGGQLATTAGNVLYIRSPAGKLVAEYDLGGELAFCRYVDRDRVFLAGQYTGVVKVADGAATRLVREQTTGGGVAPDGKAVATVTEQGAVRVHDPDTGRVLQTLGGASEAVWAAAWAADGTPAFGTRGERPDGGVNPTFPLTRSFGLSELEPGGPPAGAAGRGAAERGVLRLQKAGKIGVELRRDGALVHRFALPVIGTGDGEVRAFTFLDDDRAAAADGNGRIFLLDLKSGAVAREWKGHTGAVWALAPSPDGRWLLSGSNDHTVRVWSRDRDEPVVSLLAARDDWIVWTPEGYYACSPGGERLVGWAVGNGPGRMMTYHPAARFRASLYRPDVIQLLLKEGSVEKALAAADAVRGKETAPVAVAEVLPPVVVITSPDRPKVEAKDPTLDIRFVARPVGKHPLTAARLLVDGRPYAGADAVKPFNPPRAGEVREAWTVKLPPGTHTLAVVAETAVSKAVSDPVEVTYGARGAAFDPDVQKKQEELRRPALYVLAVGVSEYADPKLTLKCAAKDAEALVKATEAGGAGLFRKVEVRLLTDGKATRKEILQGLTWLRKQMTQNDVAVISFAGHGAKDADGTFYLLPADADTADLLSTAVPGDQVKKTLAGIPGRFILLLDACHSGGIDGDGKRAAGGGTDDLVRDLATDDYGVVVLCSATGKEFALESARLGHGYFTLAVLEGLGGKADYNKDGVVHLSEIDLYVTDRVKELSDGRQHPVTVRPASVRSFPLAKN